MENNNSNQHPISNNIKQKRNFFHRHLDWLHSILKKMHRKFEGNRPIRKKSYAISKNGLKCNTRFAVQSGRKEDFGLQLSTISRPESGPFLLFQVCFKFLQVFAPSHPPFYHIPIYSPQGLTHRRTQIMSIQTHWVSLPRVYEYNFCFPASVTMALKNTVECMHSYRKQTHPSLDRTLYN